MSHPVATNLNELYYRIIRVLNNVCACIRSQQMLQIKINGDCKILENKPLPHPHGGKATAKELVVVLTRRLEVNEMKRVDTKMGGHLIREQRGMSH